VPEAARPGGHAETPAVKPAPWPHSGSDVPAESSEDDARPADPTGSAQEPGRMRSTDVTRPFVGGPEPTGADARNGSTTDNSDPDDSEAKRGAHRLHTGAYPVVSEPVSMRPRNEPAPEPAELFRPAAREGRTSDPHRAATPDTTVKVAAVEATNGADARSLAPIPPGADTSDGRNN